MTVAVARKSSTRRTLLLAALGVLLIDVFAGVISGGASKHINKEDAECGEE